MKRIVLAACCACAALALCGRASANVSFGITEDTGALGDPTTFYSTLNDLGTNENRIAISWDPAKPTTIPDQASLDFWVPQATIHAVRIIFAVSPAHPKTSRLRRRGSTNSPLSSNSWRPPIPPSRIS